MQRLYVAVTVLLLSLGMLSHAAHAVICAPVHGGTSYCADCVSWADLTAYLVPSYPGWQTAKQTQTQTIPSPGTTYTRKYLYGPTQFALVKFNDPHSVETYTWDSSYIYLTAENDVNGSSTSRTYPAGGGFPGLIWMPRYGCTETSPRFHNRDFNTFLPGYNSEVYYTGCNSCPCQYSYTNPAHTSRHSSLVYFINYDYGGSLGMIPTVVKQDTYDDNSGTESYYFGLGYGLLRFEAYSYTLGRYVVVGQETAETPNQPIPDQACFHP